MTPPEGALFALPAEDRLGDGVVLLRGFARDPAILDAVRGVQSVAPPRRMSTPGGYSISVAMTSCGALGWVTDRAGYRYDTIDPDSGKPWPTMPVSLRALATRAAVAAGFDGFAPDSCLINLYEPGARLSLHQDRNERDFAQPIVSVSLGLPAVFLLGGPARTDATHPIALSHGDVLVFGGPARLFHHGVKPLKAGEHPATGACRINLTFRKAR
jgi:alkylated DNA repair protein (DNA oxidative demethylase)